MNTSSDTSPVTRSRWRGMRRFGAGFAAVLALYLVVTYLVIPAGWIEYEHRHPALDALPYITTTGDDHPGDPVNVAVVASADHLNEILRAAGWFKADPLGLRSDVEIAADTVLKRSYDEAPVSSLILWGRKEDIAFEQPVDNDPRQRHHVRFWKSEKVDAQNRPLWAGSATYDKRVGLSHTTGQVTHHIAENIDAERDHLFGDLKKTGDLADVQIIDDFHKVREGKNGGGDPWRTDGRLFIGISKPSINP